MLASSALLSTSSRHFTFPEQNRLFVEAFENAWKKPHTRLIYEPRNWPASPQTPTIRITITSRAGRSSRLLSGNPYPLLIPWIVDSGLQSESNYCTALTGIILKLIWPDGAPKVNRDRVMRQVISDSLLRSGLLDQLEALEVRNLHGDVVTAVEKRFHIISSRLDHNGEWDATLKAYEFPLNLTIKLHLSATGKSRRSFTSIRPFLRSIDRHIQRVRSLRSFVDYVRTRSDVRVDLLFHDDRSVDPLDEAHIRQALAEVGNRRGGSAVSEYLSVSTMLLIREGADDCPAKSSWIILPDRRMFLWRFTGDRVLKWKSERFETASVRDRGLYCGLVPWTTPDDSRKGWFASPSDR